MARPLGELYKRKVDNHPVRAYQWKIDDNDLSGTWAIIDELVKQGREILCTEDEIRKDRLFWQMTSVDGIDWHEDDWVLWDGAQLFMIPNQFFDRDYEKVG